MKELRLIRSCFVVFHQIRSNSTRSGSEEFVYQRLGHQSVNDWNINWIAVVDLRYFQNDDGYGHDRRGQRETQVK